MDTQFYARLIDNVVVEPPIAFNPKGFYAPEIVETFKPCPADTRQGAVFDPATGGFSNPPVLPDLDPVEPPPAEPAYRTKVSKVEYYGLFEPEEEAVIRLTASKTVTAEMLEAATDQQKPAIMAVAVLKVMLARVDNLAPTQLIDLADQQVQKGISLLVQMDLLTDERAGEIGRGVAVQA